MYLDTLRSCAEVLLTGDATAVQDVLAQIVTILELDAFATYVAVPGGGSLVQ